MIKNWNVLNLFDEKICVYIFEEIGERERKKVDKIFFWKGIKRILNLFVI